MMNSVSDPLLIQNVQAGLFLRLQQSPPGVGQRVLLGVDARNTRCHWLMVKTPTLRPEFHICPASAPELCLGLLQAEDVPAGEEYRRVAFCAIVANDDHSALWTPSWSAGMYRFTNAVMFQIRPGDIPPFHVAPDGHIYPLFPQLLSMHVDFGAFGNLAADPLDFPIPLPGHPVCCVPLGLNAISDWRLLHTPCAELTSFLPPLAEEAEPETDRFE